MIKVANQTIYKCEHCGRRYLSRSGVKKHEPECRKNPESPRNPEVCQHEEVLTSWTPIFGEEHRMEPDYDYCTNCGMKF